MARGVARRSGSPPFSAEFFSLDPSSRLALLHVLPIDLAMLHVVAHCRRAIVTAALLLLLAPVGCGRVLAPLDEGNPLTDVAFQSTAHVDASGQWPGWRGGAKAGVSSDENVAISWSTDHGVRWKTTVPGRGNSSPVVWDEAVLITTAVERRHGSQLKLLCYDRGNGALRWQANLGLTQSATSDKNGHASATVATDGDAIFSYGGGLGLFCHDFDGQRRWHVTIEQIDHIWGTASSPVLHGSLVIQLCEGRSGSFIAAYDKQSGQQVWRQQRDSRGCWSTPVIVETRVGETSRTELIVNGTGADTPRGGWVIAYNPANGDELWRLKGTTDVVCPTLIVGEDRVYSTSGRNGPIIAIRPGGEGDVTGSKKWRRWHIRRGGAHVSTGVAYRRRLFTISDGGVLACRRAETGKEVWRRRLGRNFTASLIVAGGNIYATSERGTVYVMAADDANELLATNQMNQRTLATPAVSHGDLFLRTESRLFCIAAVGSGDDAGKDVLAEGDTADNERPSPSPSDPQDIVPTLPEATSAGDG